VLLPVVVDGTATMEVLNKQQQCFTGPLGGHPVSGIWSQLLPRLGRVSVLAGVKFYPGSRGWSTACCPGICSILTQIGQIVLVFTRNRPILGEFTRMPGFKGE
jgi:hypothetical protein